MQGAFSGQKFYEGFVKNQPLLKKFFMFYLFNDDSRLKHTF